MEKDSIISHRDEFQWYIFISTKTNFLPSTERPCKSEVSSPSFGRAQSFSRASSFRFGTAYLFVLWWRFARTSRDARERSEKRRRGKGGGRGERRYATRARARAIDRGSRATQSAARLIDELIYAAVVTPRLRQTLQRARARDDSTPAE